MLHRASVAHLASPYFVLMGTFHLVRLGQVSKHYDLSLFHKTATCYLMHRLLSNAMATVYICKLVTIDNCVNK